LTNGSRSPHENGDGSKQSSSSRHKQSHQEDNSRSPHSDNGSTRSTPSQKVNRNDKQIKVSIDFVRSFVRCRVVKKVAPHQ